MRIALRIAGVLCLLTGLMSRLQSGTPPATTRFAALVESNGWATTPPNGRHGDRELYSMRRYNVRNANNHSD